MERYQKSPEKEINAPVVSNQPSDEPNSAHANKVAEKYVKKRKDKAERQSVAEHKMDAMWTSMKYVIL